MKARCQGERGREGVGASRLGCSPMAHTTLTSGVAGGLGGFGPGATTGRSMKCQALGHMESE